MVNRNKHNSSCKSPRPKMPLDLRAKQFMPFAAVTGLNKALREKEKEIEEEAEKRE